MQRLAAFPAALYQRSRHGTAVQKDCVKFVSLKENLDRRTLGSTYSAAGPRRQRLQWPWEGVRDCRADCPPEPEMESRSPNKKKFDEEVGLRAH